MAELLPWQQGLWQQLTGPGVRAHAWLLHGPAGIGKLQLAQHLAAHQLCSAPTAAGACGQCKGCLLRQAGTHPDFIQVQPDEEGRQIRIDQIRELVEFVVRTPQMGGRKLVLIEPLEALNPNAANALLKSLEEPSGDTLLLLVSHQPSLLLPTLRSRCLQLACPRPDAASARQWLAARLAALAPDELDELLYLAAGSPLRACALYLASVQGERPSILVRRQAVEEQLKQVLRGQLLPSKVADDWKDIDLLLLLDWFYGWLLQVQRLQVIGADAPLDEPRMEKLLLHTGRQAAPVALAALQDWVLAERQKVLARSPLKRELILESLLVRWARLLSAG